MPALEPDVLSSALRVTASIGASSYYRDCLVKPLVTVAAGVLLMCPVQSNDGNVPWLDPACSMSLAAAYNYQLRW